MTELEAMGKDYLFKLKRSQGVKALIGQVHGQRERTRFNNQWSLWGRTHRKHRLFPHEGNPPGFQRHQYPGS
jgi:hypothetical protein